MVGIPEFDYEPDIGEAGDMFYYNKKENITYWWSDEELEWQEHTNHGEDFIRKHETNQDEFEDHSWIW